MKKWMLLLLAVTLSAPVLAEKGGHFGMSFAVGVNWLLDIDSATINRVDKDQPAERAGIVVGDTITSIEGCAIPGCGAYKARNLADKAVGETLHMTLRHAGGEEYPVALVAEPPPPKPK